jgi:hypothetical protein
MSNADKKAEESEIGVTNPLPSHFTAEASRIKKTELKWWQKWLNYDWLVEKAKTNPVIKVLEIFRFIFVFVFIFAFIAAYTFFVIYYKSVLVGVGVPAIILGIVYIVTKTTNLLGPRPSIWIGTIMLLIGIALILVEIFN